MARAYACNWRHAAHGVAMVAIRGATFYFINKQKLEPAERPRRGQAPVRCTTICRPRCGRGAAATALLSLFQEAPRAVEGKSRSQNIYSREYFIKTTNYRYPVLFKMSNGVAGWEAHFCGFGCRGQRTFLLHCSWLMCTLLIISGSFGCIQAQQPAAHPPAGVSRIIILALCVYV